MPNPWKKAKLGGVPRLVFNVRSKAKQGIEESPLVVQAGFPTSVADLVVKNRGRLRKPTRWLRHRARRDEGGEAAGCSSTMATLASEIIAASVSAAARPPPSPVPTEQPLQRSPRVAGVMPREGYELPGDAHCSPSTRSSPAGLDAGRASPGSPLVTTTTAKMVMDHDFEPLSGADVAKDELLHGLSWKKVPKNEIFQPFATSRTPNDGGSPTSVPVTEALKHEALNGSDGPTAETDVSRQAFPEPEVPRAMSMESLPIAEARKDEATRPSFVVESPERKVLEGGSGRGPVVVVVKVVFLVVILALVSKKMAIMISLLAAAILLVESIGRRLFPSMRPAAEQCLGAIAASDLIQTPDELNSHDSDGIPTNSSGSFGSERNWRVGGLGAPVDVTEALTGETAVAASQEKVVVETEGCVVGGHKAPAASKKKKKKLFRKLVSVKFRGCKCGKEGKLEEKLELASDPGGSGEAPCRRVLVEASSGGQQEEEDEDEEEAEEEGQGVDSEKRDGTGEEEEEVDGSGIPATALRVDLRDSTFVGGKVGEATNGSSGYLVSVLVVLLGLLRGRMMALILTVLSYSLVSYARSLWRRWNSQALCRAKEE